MVYVLERLTGAAAAAATSSPTAAATTIVAATSSAPPATASASGGRLPLPSLADRNAVLEEQNRRLRATVRRLRRTAYGGLVPTDTLDLALLVSVMALVVFVGKVALSR